MPPIELESGPVRSIVVVGGGSAGYLTALALHCSLPEIEVTLVESSRIPVIGVGEATTTLMPPFLHKRLKIDVDELYREVRPTWKLGIEFLWGQPGTYAFEYPFGCTAALEAFAHDGNLANQSVAAMMMRARRSPLVRGQDGRTISLLGQMKFAYHLENRPFVGLLAKHAQRIGVEHIDAEVLDVALTGDGHEIDHLVLDQGRELHADLFVDATGFRALLIEKALRSPFIDYSSSLFCDRAIVGNVQRAGAVAPHTTAETMQSGWCWRIPVDGEDHRGYVYSSNHLGDDQALAEMRSLNQGLSETWSVRFRSGRHREFWKGNTVAVGNAYGFVEPLQSTALHMVILETAYLIGGLQADGPPDARREFANTSLGAHWDFLRWFLALHYKFNGKRDSDFWRDCRRSTDISGLQPVIDRFSAVGPWQEDSALRYSVGDPAFSFEGLMIMLLGMGASCPPPGATSFPSEKWTAHVAECRSLVEQALPQREALDLLRQQPELLRDWIEAPNSWINSGGELISTASQKTGIVHPEPVGLTDLQDRPFEHLLML